MHSTVSVRVEVVVPVLYMAPCHPVLSAFGPEPSMFTWRLLSAVVQPPPVAFLPPPQGRKPVTSTPGAMSVEALMIWYPETPGVPGSPFSPLAPGAPGAPAAPGAPVSPLAPGAPGAPVSPLAPGAPGAPVSPLSPLAPGAPAAP